MSVTEAAPARQPDAIALTSTAVHPTGCPSWCKDRDSQSRHHFGPTATWHWSPQYRLASPASMDATGDTLLRVELVQSDEGDEVGGTRLYVSGESDAELGRDEVDHLIVQAQALVDTLRIMRRQMGSSR